MIFFVGRAVPAYDGPDPGLNVNELVDAPRTVNPSVPIDQSSPPVNASVADVLEFPIVTACAALLVPILIAPVPASIVTDWALVLLPMVTAPASETPITSLPLSLMEKSPVLVMSKMMLELPASVNVSE